MAQFEAQPRVDVLADSQWGIDTFPSEATPAPPIEHTDHPQPVHLREAADLDGALSADITTTGHADRPPASGAVGKTSEPSRVLEPSARPTREASAPETTISKRADTATVSPKPDSPADSTPEAFGPAGRQQTRTESPVRDLSGWWSVTNRVESTAYQRFENLNLGYRVKLTHKGDQISRTGRKWMENGRPVAPAQRTVIAVSGTVERQRVTLWFTEYGTRRTSTGSFAYDISDTGVLQGSFTSDVAQSKGSSRAARMQTRE